MGAAVNHTDEGKEERCHEAVREHLQHGTRHGRLVEHEDGEEHHAAVAHRRVGIDILEVGLHTCAKCAIDDADAREREKYPAQLRCGIGHQEDGDAEAAVASQFHEHAGMEHRHRCGGRSMAVGRPCVEGEHGAKHAEAHKGHREEEELPVVRNGIVVSHLKQIHREGARIGARVEVDAQNTQHEKCRPAHEHERELHSRVVLVARAPHADEQIHGDEGHLIEHEHSEQVDRDEEAEHTCREQKEPHEELTWQRVHLPRGKHTGKHDESREQNHGHRHAVDAKGQFNIKWSIPSP